MSKRFGVVDALSAYDLGALASKPDEADRQLYAAHLVEYNVTPDGKARLVGHDGYEPEDATLFRSFSWVPVEMNKLAAEAAEWRAKYEALLPK